MRHLTVLAVLVVGAVALIALPQPGGTIPSDVCASVSGGCTVENFSKCAHAVLEEGDPCANCAAGYDCDSSHTTEACTPLTNTAAEDCISCGTCFEDCGGTQRSWSKEDCTGTFITPMACTASWVDAQNSTCAVACPNP